MQKNGMMDLNKKERDRQRQTETERDVLSRGVLVLKEENQVRKRHYGVFESSSLFWSQNGRHQKYYRRQLSG